MDYLDEFVTAFVDDLLIYSENELDHEMHVKKVLEWLQAAGLQASIKKCEFHVQETEFLEHWITTESIQMEKTKVQAIKDWPELKNIKEVQQFTDLINYYQ